MNICHQCSNGWPVETNFCRKGSNCVRKKNDLDRARATIRTLGGNAHISYRSDRQQIDPAILIANHPIRGGEISSPAIRPLDQWPLKVHSGRQQFEIRSLAAKVHFDRQHFDHWRAKFVLNQQFDPWHPQNHFESVVAPSMAVWRVAWFAKGTKAGPQDGPTHFCSAKML